MRSAGKLSVEIADLLGGPGATKQLRFSERVEGLAMPLARVPDAADLDFSLRFDSIVEGIHVSGPVVGVVLMDCSRCEASFEQDLRVWLDEVFADTAVEDADYRVEGDRIDLEPAVRDAVVLELPLNPLCRPGCRGLCPVCGEDRNITDCGHQGQRIDLRWEPLRRLLGGD